jgi:hypothetical protein
VLIRSWPFRRRAVAVLGVLLAACCATVAPLPPAQAIGLPPTVVTQPASGIYFSGATVNATVNPNGSEVTYCQFQYGPPVYGEFMPCTPLPGSGSDPEAVSAHLGALHITSEYHFRVVASNAGGTSYGAFETFTTGYLPPFVETEPASSVGELAATLNGEAFIYGGTIESCSFAYWTPSTLPQASEQCARHEQRVNVSADVRGLQPNTTYLFRLAIHNGGVGYLGLVKEFTTLPTFVAGSALSTPAVSPSTKPSGTSHARRSPQELARALRTHLGLLSRRERVCARFPATGEEAIVVVARRRAVRSARRLLSAAKVIGGVEVRTHDQYASDTARLSRLIARQIPRPYRTVVHVSAERSRGHLECIKASIELVHHQRAPQGLNDWAASEVRQYGGDRVRYRHK